MTFVPANTLLNLSEVRDLDLSLNELPAPPNSAWHSMHHLRSLRLAGNPITRISNESFVGLQHLEHLDITSIPAESFQVSASIYGLKRIISTFFLFLLRPLNLISHN